MRTRQRGEDDIPSPSITAIVSSAQEPREPALREVLRNTSQEGTKEAMVEYFAIDLIIPCVFL